MLVVSQSSGYYVALSRRQKSVEICATSVHMKAIHAANDSAYGSRRKKEKLKNYGRNVCGVSLELSDEIERHPYSIVAET